MAKVQLEPRKKMGPQANVVESVDLILEDDHPFQKVNVRWNKDGRLVIGFGPSVGPFVLERMYNEGTNRVHSIWLAPQDAPSQ